MKSLTHNLSVPKGEDIRMVYNGTSSGLNNALWDPSVCPTNGSKHSEGNIGGYLHGG